MNNQWIFTDRFGNVFVTHDNVGWIVDRDLESKCVNLTDNDLKHPATSLRHNARNRVIKL